MLVLELGIRVGIRSRFWIRVSDAHVYETPGYEAVRVRKVWKLLHTIYIVHNYGNTQHSKPQHTESILE